MHYTSGWNQTARCLSQSQAFMNSKGMQERFLALPRWPAVGPLVVGSCQHSPCFSSLSSHHTPMLAAHTRNVLLPAAGCRGNMLPRLSAPRLVCHAVTARPSCSSNKIVTSRAGVLRCRSVPRATATFATATTNLVQPINQPSLFARLAESALRLVAVASAAVIFRPALFSLGSWILGLSCRVDQVAAVCGLASVTFLVLRRILRARHADMTTSMLRALQTELASLNLKASTMEELADKQIPVLGELAETGIKCVFNVCVQYMCSIYVYLYYAFCNSGWRNP